MRKEDGTYRTYEEMVAEGIPLRYDAQYTNSDDETLSDLNPDTGVGEPTPAFTYSNIIGGTGIAGSFWATDTTMKLEK
jgi:aldehyde oxidoreductase